jgi:K+ transporter
MLGRFAEGIYAFMQRNAVAADRAFQIPPKQVIEVGIQLDV